MAEMMYGWGQDMQPRMPRGISQYGGGGRMYAGGSPRFRERAAPPFSRDAYESGGQQQLAPGSGQMPTNVSWEHERGFWPDAQLDAAGGGGGGPMSPEQQQRMQQAAQQMFRGQGGGGPFGGGAGGNPPQMVQRPTPRPFQPQQRFMGGGMGQGGGNAWGSMPTRPAPGGFDIGTPPTAPPEQGGMGPALGQALRAAPPQGYGPVGGGAYGAVPANTGGGAPASMQSFGSGAGPIGEQDAFRARYDGGYRTGLEQQLGSGAVNQALNSIDPGHSGQGGAQAAREMQFARGAGYAQPARFAWDQYKAQGLGDYDQNGWRWNQQGIAGQ